MVSPPTISVVIPCLNRANFLRPTIESVLKQDHPAVECIVVDGGSTDGTVEILRSYGDQIRWISEPDNGHADAINKGWRMASGEVLAWLNADDLWQVPAAATTAASYLVEHPGVDVVYGDCTGIDEHGHHIGWTYLHGWDLEYAAVACDHCIPQPAAFLRRSIVERVGWLDCAFYQKKDHELWLRIAAMGGVIRYLPTPLAAQREVRGLSYDGESAAPACLQVTRTFFERPELPDSLGRRRGEAMWNARRMAMRYAAVGGPAWAPLFAYAASAVLTRPTNVVSTFRHFRHCVWLARQELSRQRATANDAPASATESRQPASTAHRLATTLHSVMRGSDRVLILGQAGLEFAEEVLHPGGSILVVDDTSPVVWPRHPSVRYAILDIFKTLLPECYFDGAVAIRESPAHRDFQLARKLSTLVSEGPIVHIQMTAQRPDEWCLHHWEGLEVNGQWTPRDSRNLESE